MSTTAFAHKPLDWPEEFKEDNSDLWRQSPDYETRMAIISMFALAAFGLLPEVK